MDENLFYKGVDKTKVHGARLYQVHSLADPIDTHRTDPLEKAGANSSDHTGCKDPPHAFDSGNSLLALTKKHNVRYSAHFILVCVLKKILLDDHRSDCA